MLLRRHGHRLHGQVQERVAPDPQQDGMEKGRRLRLLTGRRVPPLGEPRVAHVLHPRCRHLRQRAPRHRKRPRTSPSPRLLGHEQHRRQPNHLHGNVQAVADGHARHRRPANPRASHHRRRLDRHHRQLHRQPRDALQGCRRGQALRPDGRGYPRPEPHRSQAPRRPLAHPGHERPP